ncbi:MAG: hypothetical protein JW881_06140 [Spirochaetales bacterium]|nr:hypothetical protein [Spirochaetales bacterium]
MINIEEYVPLKDELNLLYKQHGKYKTGKGNTGESGFPEKISFPMESPHIPARDEQASPLLPAYIISNALSIPLDIYRTCILVLKGMWETSHEKTKSGNGNRPLSREDTDGEKEHQGIRFKPDVSGLYPLIREASLELIRNSATLEESEKCQFGDFDEKSLHHLLQEMLLTKIYFFSINSKEVEDFIRKKKDEYELLKQAPEKLKQEYWLARCVWVELQEELSELLMLLESARLKNAYIVREFLHVFGECYISLKEQIIRVLSLKRRLLLKETHPGWSIHDIDEKVKKLGDEEEAEMEKLKFNAKMACFVHEVKPGKPINDQTLNEYKKKVKTVLRQIYFILHPHRLMHHPQFQTLTEKQRNHLMKLWDRVMEIRQHELRYPEGTVGHYMHSLEKLLSLRDKADKILSHSGLRVNVNYIIAGDTIEERIAWLENEIKQLEKDIQYTRDEIMAFQNNKDILEKKAALSCPARHEQVKVEMHKRAVELKSEAEELESTYRLLFEKN